MTDPEFKDAQELWKLTYADNAIDQVGKVIVLILKNDIRRNHALFNPLVTAIYTTYGRPFLNNRPVGKLDLQLFSAEQIEFHKHLMRLRDQFFAHTDVEANTSKAHGPLLHVGYAFNVNQPPAAFTTSIQPQREHLRMFLSYLKSIHPLICSRKQFKFHGLLAHRPTQDAEYILNVYDKSKPLWLTKQEAQSLSIPEAKEFFAVDPPQRKAIKKLKK